MEISYTNAGLYSKYFKWGILDEILGYMNMGTCNTLHKFWSVELHFLAQVYMHTPVCVKL